MAQKAGCGQQLLGGVILVVFLGWLISRCDSRPQPAPSPPAASTPSAAVPASDGPAEAKPAAPSPEPTLDTVGAVAAAKETVRKHLKYPHDAEFPWFEYEVTGNPKTGLHWVTSTVKAKNAFGASLTHSWSVQLTKTGNNWTTQVCTIDDQVVYMDQKTADAMNKLAHALSPDGQREVADKAAAEKKRADDETRKTRRAEEAKQRREAFEKSAPERAAGFLKAAKRLEGEARTKWLKRIVEEYPGTEAATEAESLLKEGETQ